MIPGSSPSLSVGGARSRALGAGDRTAAATSSLMRSLSAASEAASKEMGSGMLCRPGGTYNRGRRGAGG